MGLFDKKYCDICKEKIGLLGNRKLTDGNLCKNCAAKLSPWFSERRQSTVEEIAQQLQYREDNRQAAAEFKTSRSFGELKKFLVDEGKMQFTITSARNLADDNPDIIPCSDIIGCSIDINESRSEVTYKDSEGKSVSYNPPLYKYSYDWYAVVSVNHPYFNEMRFKLNSSTVTIEPTIPAVPTAKAASKLGTHTSSLGAARSAAAAKINPATDIKYQRCDAMAEELKAYINGLISGPEPEEIPQSVVCPYCGATTTPDAKGCCEYCGGPLK